MRASHPCPCLHSQILSNFAETLKNALCSGAPVPQAQTIVASVENVVRDVSRSGDMCRSARNARMHASIAWLWGVGGADGAGGCLMA